MTTDARRPPDPLPASADADLSLDPQDWDAFRALAHRMVDDSLEHLRTLRDRPPWTPPPPDVAAVLTGEPLSCPTPPATVTRGSGAG